MKKYKRILIYLVGLLIVGHIYMLFVPFDQYRIPDSKLLEGNIIFKIRALSNQYYLVKHDCMVSEIKELDVYDNIGNINRKQINEMGKYFIDSLKSYTSSIYKKFANSSFSLSPQKKYAVFYGADKYKGIFNISTNKFRNLIPYQSYTIRDFAWSGDGKYLTYLIRVDKRNEYYEFVVVDLNSMKIIKQIILNESIGCKINWSPNYEKIAVLSVKYRYLWCPINWPFLFFAFDRFSYYTYSLVLYDIKSDTLEQMTLIEDMLTNRHFEIEDMYWLDN